MASELITTTRCECCNDPIYNISIDNDSVSYDPDYGFNLHLSHDELQSLYIEFKEVLLHS